MQISVRNLRKLDCAEKSASTFSHPALEQHRPVDGLTGGKS